MSTLSAHPAPREASGRGARLWAGLGAAGPVIALGGGLAAHLTSTVDPMTALVSDYALGQGPHAAMLTATLALAMGCLWSTYGLAQVAPAASAASRLLLACSAFGLLLTAVFPTDAAMGVTSLGGELHRFAAAAVFTGLPCAAWMLARGRPAAGRWLWLRTLAATSVALLGAFLAAHPGSLFSDLIDGAAYYGLLQRLLLVAETILVLLVAAAIPYTTEKRHLG